MKMGRSLPGNDKEAALCSYSYRSRQANLLTYPRNRPKTARPKTTEELGSITLPSSSFPY
jgi:hypothetical protein